MSGSRIEPVPRPGRPFVGDALAAALAPPIVGVIAMLVYVRTLLPGLAFGDWGEMQTVPHILGIAHPTGYPTYILLAWLAELVPIGSVAVRANLLSALLVAASLASATAISLQLGVRPLAAIAASLALGVIGTVWAAATVAEVNPLHLLLCALLLHRALVWEARRATSDLVIGGVLVGLAVGNHLLTLFVAPFIVAFVAWVGRRDLLARPWLAGLAVLALVIGLSVYAYIPIAASRSPALPYNHPVTLESFLWLVSGAQFRGQFDFLSSKGPGVFLGSLEDLRDLAFSRATPILPLLGLAGIAILVVRRTAFGLMSAAILVMGCYLWANYLRLEHYLLVPWLLLGIGAAVALETVARAIDAVGGRWSGRQANGDARIGLLVGVLGVALAVVLTGMNWRAADRSGNRSGDEYVSETLGSLPANAAILSYWDASTPLWHAQHVEGIRPDVLIVDDTNIVYEGWGTREARIAAVICERPVFILRLDPRDLEPTERMFRLTPFIAVRVAAGGPTATSPSQVYSVEPLDPATCGG
jgi:transmembrane protein TMEM260 (protein O-mannosyltransferase)